jgi:SAM-dependent methyltransferase
VKPHHAVLDLGCGYGEFINQVTAARKYGMDLNPETTSKLKSDIGFLQQDCSMKWALDDATLDVVFTSNLFEHLPDKPALSRTLAEARRCLRQGGLLIAMGPNINAIGAQYWDFWDHYLPLTEKSLDEGLKLAGFEVDYVVPSFLSYTKFGSPDYPLWTLSLYLKHPFLLHFFGGQFLLVARRPVETEPF